MRNITALAATVLRAAGAHGAPGPHVVEALSSQAWPEAAPVAPAGRKTARRAPSRPA